MGLEAKCRVRLEGRETEGMLQFEGDALLFRGGEVRLKIPRAGMSRIAAEDGELQVTYEGGAASFALGPAAAKWADKVANPPTLLDKLGVKQGMRVSLMGQFDAAFVDQLRTRAGEVAERPKKDSAVVLLLAVTRADLDKAIRAREFLSSNGGLWIVYPKGIQAITEMNVLEAGRAIGLKDNKVCSFSGTHTALRFVIPLAARVKST